MPDQYFTLLHKTAHGSLELSAESIRSAMRLKIVTFDDQPEALAKAVNNSPGLLDDLKEVANLSYAHHLLAHGQRFTDQGAFPRFFNALDEDNKRTLAHLGLLKEAVNYGDPDFVDTLVALFPQEELSFLLKALWQSSSFSVTSRVGDTEPNIPMLRKIVGLMGLDLLREAEGGGQYPYSNVASAIFSEFDEVFDILSPSIPDGATFKQIILMNPYNISGVMKWPKMARFAMNILCSDDFVDIMLNHEGWTAACRSSDAALLEEVWNLVPVALHQQLLDSTTNAALETAVNVDNPLAIRFLWGKIPPEARLQHLKGSDEEPFGVIKLAITENKHHLLPELIEGLSENELANLLTVLPSARPYLLDKIIDPTSGAADGAQEPKHGLPLWLQLYGSGASRWHSMLGIPPPHQDLVDKSPFGFSPKIYHELLPTCQYACKIEGNEDAELNAYKLAVLFGNVEEAAKYVNKFFAEVTTSLDGKPVEVKQPMHDACQFEIPENGIWRSRLWRGFLQRYPVQGRAFIGIAPTIEEIAQKINEPFPITLDQMKKIAAHARYRHAAENLDFAKIAYISHVPEVHFNKCLEIVRQYGSVVDTLPDITIDGSEVGFPGYRFEKLKKSDPLALIFGYLLNNCQAIGKAGAEYALHSATSPWGGVYVWRKMNCEFAGDPHRIIAGSWTWIGEDNAIVFDSFERLGPDYNDLALPFLLNFASKVAGSRFSSVRLGVGGETPELNLPKAEIPSRWRDYTYKDGTDAQFDSKEQYVIA